MELDAVPEGVAREEALPGRGVPWIDLDARRPQLLARRVDVRDLEAEVALLAGIGMPLLGGSLALLLAIALGGTVAPANANGC